MMRFILVLALGVFAASAAPAEKARYLSVTFDDGWDVPSSVWETFDAAGIVGTTYLYTQPLTEKWPAFLTWADAVALHEHGWEIGSHTVSHATLTELWGEPIIEELVLSRLEILKNTGVDPTSFSIPFGAFDGRVSWYMDRYFSSAVKAWGNYGMNDWIDPMSINRLSVTETIAAGWVCSKIREIPPGGWFVLLFHQIGLEGSEYSCTTQQFRQIVGCISDGVEKDGIIVDTVSGVLERNRRAWLAEHLPYPDGVGP